MRSRIYKLFSLVILIACLASVLESKQVDIKSVENKNVVELLLKEKVEVEKLDKSVIEVIDFVAKRLKTKFDITLCLKIRATEYDKVKNQLNTKFKKELDLFLADDDPFSKEENKNEVSGYSILLLVADIFAGRVEVENSREAIILCYATDRPN